MSQKSKTKSQTKKTTPEKTNTKNVAAEAVKADTSTAIPGGVEEVKVEKPVEAKAEKAAEKPVEAKAEKAAEKHVEAKAEKAAEKPAEAKAEKAAEKPAEAKAEKAEEKPVEVKAEKAEKEEKPAKKTARTTKKAAAEKKATAEKKTTKAAAKSTAKTTKTSAAKKTTKAAKAKAEEVKAEKTIQAEAVKTEEVVKAEEVKVEEVQAEVYEEPRQEVYVTPRKSIAFIGSECYPFVKTGGLGDVMYALPKALVKQNCDVKVILPRYKCIPWEYQEKMVYKGAFQMRLCSDGKEYYVGIMEYVWDGVVYDFIDNEEFFGNGNPYTNLVDDIPKYCYFSKAALAALNYMDWIPDIIHCHDWQAALVPVYLRTLFENTRISSAKTILTIHNLKFQGVYNIPTLRYWTDLPDRVFTTDVMKVKYTDANMLKAGLTYANMITTVSYTYAGEIQTAEYGENLDAHLRYHSGKLRGIVNGIDYEMWNPATDARLDVNYDITNVLEKKKENKRKLQEELGLVQDDHMFVIGLISRLTDQKGLDLLNSIIPQIMDEHTQIVVLGTGDPMYEDSFRYYENAYKGRICSNIMYDETRAHKINAGADAILVPSRFEPCGLTQLNAMHYGSIPIVRETGGLKDTVEPYNMFANTGNGFTFDRYDAGLLLDAINRAKTLYFTNRWCWDEMVQRDMAKDVSWDNSAKQYKDLYLSLCW